jgi:hypothetical protein
MIAIPTLAIVPPKLFYWKKVNWTIVAKIHIGTIIE